MKKMWLFICCSSGTKAVFLTYEEAMKFCKKWLHYAIDSDWCYEEGEDWCLHEVGVEPKTVEEFYEGNV